MVDPLPRALSLDLDSRGTSALWITARNVPLPDDWGKRRRCAYLLLSAAPYGQSAAEARAYGWPVIEIAGVHHLAIATDAGAVTDALLDLVAEGE